MREEKVNLRPDRYSKISLKKRQKLVDLVINRSVSIFRASKRLRIKNSTAKLIIKRFKKDSTFFESKKMKQARERRQKEQNKKKEGPNATGQELNNPSIPQSGQTVSMTVPLDNYLPLEHWTYFLMPLHYTFVPLA